MPHPTHARLTGDSMAESRYAAMVATFGVPQGSEDAVLVTLARLLSYDETAALLQYASRSLVACDSLVRKVVDHVDAADLVVPLELAEQLRTFTERNGS